MHIPYRFSVKYDEYMTLISVIHTTISQIYKLYG
jgi:hypothetical protein